MVHSKRFIEHFISLLPPKANVLDVCSGTDSLGILKTLHEASCRVYALDFSESTINRVLNEYHSDSDGHQHLENVNFVIQDIRERAFQKNSFDAITAIFALDYLHPRDHLKTFQVFHEILKPKGIILLSFSKNSPEYNFKLNFPLILDLISQTNFTILDHHYGINSPYSWLVLKKC